MIFRRKGLQWLFLLFWITGCDSWSPPVQEPLDPFTTELGPSALQLEGQVLVGSGRVRSQAALASPRSNLHLKITGQFLSQSSRFMVHLFFDDFLYDTGLILRLSVSEENPESIDIDFAEPGQAYQHLTTIEKSLSDNLFFSLRFDLAQQLNNQRVLLIWNEALYLDSLQRQARDRLTPGNADFNSLEENTLFFRWGRGHYWGLHLEEMRITEFRREVSLADL